MSVTAAEGFVASGVGAGIRPSGKPDVALVRSVSPAVGSAMWTQNRVQAAPVVVSRRHLELAEPQAVVVNAGVANAATGHAGEDDARVTAARAAHVLGLGPEEVVVLSTGVIGPRLPMEQLLAGVDAAAAALSPDGGADAAEAILTTDAGPKTAVRTGDGFTVGGMAKGAGMIHPFLATMLAVVTTDYPLGPGEADGFLRPAVEASFNRISVDGDCSTNDAVVLLARRGGGGAGAPAGALDDQFAAALDAVCGDLARQIVADGEGATVVLEIRVTSASSPEEAHSIATRVATSSLVKTAAFGRDPNWGRVLAAAGSAPFNGGFAHLDPERLRVSFDGTPVYAGGTPTGLVPELGGASCRIELDLGLGEGEAAYLASDLSTDYVKLNAEYTT
jgi:glutamate N-acetyltransferase / amino-acid N-acetyltransferase